MAEPENNLGLVVYTKLGPGDISIPRGALLFVIFDSTTPPMLRQKLVVREI